MAPKKVDLITISEAAVLAHRSRAVVHRWINEGWLPLAYAPPQKNGTKLLNRDHFLRLLPDLVAEMQSRKGGRGKREHTARGGPRPKKWASYAPPKLTLIPTKED